MVSPLRRKLKTLVPKLFLSWTIRHPPRRVNAPAKHAPAKQMKNSLACSAGLREMRSAATVLKELSAAW